MSVHGNDLEVAALEQAARCAVQASVARASYLAAVATYVARARAALGPEPDDRFGLEAMEHAEAGYAVVTQLAARLVITEPAADRLVSLALTLTTRLPATFDALAHGVIDEPRAKVVVEETELLSDAHAAVVDEAIVAHLGPLNTAELRQQVKAEVEDVDREAVKRRAKKATADRHVRLKALADGMAEMTIRAPATDVVPAYNNIEALAKDRDRPGGRADPHATLIHDGEPPGGSDGTPLDQRSQGAHRADVALDLLRQGLGDAAPSGCGPQIFVAFSAAVGLDDQPAQLDRTGAVPPVLARELLLNHRFRRVLVDPLTGHLVAVDGHSYPPGTLPDLSRREPDDGDPPAPPPDGGDPGDAGLDGGDPGDAGPDGGDPSGGQPNAPAEPQAPVDGVDRSAARRSRGCGDDLVPAPRAPASALSGATGADGNAEAADEIGEADSEEVDSEEVDSGDVDGEAPAPAAHRPCPVAAAGGGPYDIAAAILRFVRARSRRCTAPGCRRPSRQCDTDHRVPWPEGPTCPCNLAPLCRRHHLAKHRFGWEVRKASPDPADPSQHWTSPLGYEHVVRAEPLLPVTRSSALARERGAPSEAWPEDELDPAQPYWRHDWMGRTNTQEAAAALEGHARAHAPPSPPSPQWTGQYADDPPF